MIALRQVLIAVAMAVAGSAAAADMSLPQPTGEVVLTVTGAISASNADGAARFDREMLRDMPRVELTTSTIWTDGVHRFSGVPLKTLLEALGLQGETIVATAMNNYSVEIPVASLSDMPIVADLMDGSDMPVRRKGPLWIVYPYDSDEAFRSAVVYSRSIWQLNRLEVK